MKLDERVVKRIEECKKRQSNKLNLSNCGLERIPGEVFELTGLVELNLKGNEIEKIPRRITELKNLVSLTLTSNKLEQFPVEITTLDKLRDLWISNNPLKSIPAEINSMQNLKKIELANCSLSSFPKEILGLRKLSYLDLANYDQFEIANQNAISSIPQTIVQLGRLRKLLLRNNQVQELPKEIAQLDVLGLEGNPLRIPPQEIAVEKDTDDRESGGNIERISNYFEEIEKRKIDYLYEIKLLLVGEERAGKTSIAEALSDPEYKFKDQLSTKGINIINWIIPKKKYGLDKDLRVNIWDFGGQEIYHSIHQIFLTKRSLYFLVVEARKDFRHDDLFYWMNIIDKLGDKSPVIILINKCDEPHTEMAIEDYKKTFKNIVDYLKVSCKDDYRTTIENLIEETVKILKNKNMKLDIGTQLPKAWIDIRNKLEREAKEGRNYIHYSEYLSICEEYAIDEDGALFLSDFFHRLGVFLHFRNNIFLENTIFLNHEWLTKGVYNVLDNQEVINRYGKFSNRDLERIWTGQQYEGKRPELVHLMQDFELCFSLGNGHYLAPQLLPADMPGSVFDLWFRGDSKDPLHFEYHYKFMPRGILTRFIVKKNKYLSPNTSWKHGTLLEFANTQAIVREKYFESPKRITITVKGENKKVLLAMIRETLEEINRDFHDLEFIEMIPCNCNSCKDSDKPHCYKLAEELEYRIAKGKQTIECDKSLEVVNIDSLIRDVIISKQQLNRGIRNIIRERKRNRIFISYSHRDSDWLERVQINLIVLNNLGIETDVWADTRIRPAQDWDKEIKEALNSTKIALLLISTNFLASDYIMNNELPPLLEAAEQEGAIILLLHIKPSLVPHLSDIIRSQPEDNYNESLITLSKFQSINDPNKPLIDLSEGDQDRILVRMAELIAEYSISEILPKGSPIKKSKKRASSLN